MLHSKQMRTKSETRDSQANAQASCTRDQSLLFILIAEESDALLQPSEYESWSLSDLTLDRIEWLLGESLGENRLRALVVLALHVVCKCQSAQFERASC